MFTRSTAVIKMEGYRAYVAEHYPDLCVPRPEYVHQDTFGTVAVVGGNRGMVGSAILASTAALYAGCSKVLVGLNHAQNMPAVFHQHPEIMVNYAVDMVGQHHQEIDTWVMGCGMGKNDTAIQILKAIWNSSASQLVISADALLILAEYSELFPHYSKRTDLVLMPSPIEAARLLNVSVERIEMNRDWAARELASRYRAWVILKGHNTLISSARGFLLVNPIGNSGLVTAGAADVLAGVVGSLLAQGMEAEQAVPAAVWLQGTAVDILRRMHVGPIGLLPSELAQAIRWLRNRLAVDDSEQPNDSPMPVTFNYDKDFI